jgi:hypothetical protein
MPIPNWHALPTHNHNNMLLATGMAQIADTSGHNSIQSNATKGNLMITAFSAACCGPGMLCYTRSRDCAQSTAEEAADMLLTHLPEDARTQETHQQTGSWLRHIGCTKDSIQQHPTTNQPMVDSRMLLADVRFQAPHPCSRYTTLQWKAFLSFMTVKHPCTMHATEQQ